MKKLMIIILLLALPISANAESILDYAEEYGVEDLINYDLEIFKDFDLKEIQKSLISGEGFDSMNIIKKLISIVTSEFRSYLKMFLMIIISFS